MLIWSQVELIILGMILGSVVVALGYGIYSIGYEAGYNQAKREGPRGLS